MVATTNVTPTSMELTPMRVKWNDTDLGGTLNSVVVDINYMKGEIKADQYGKSIIDRRQNGLEVKVTTTLAQVRDTTTWANALPSNIAGSGGGLTSSEAALSIGRSDRDNAFLLNLHPVVLSDGDTTQDHNFYLAHPEEVTSIDYGPEKQAGLKVVWHAYPVLTGANAPYWYKYGSLSV